ncbi:hypothetical protein CRG98_036949 [Punica granatum]|uniref:Uncharacterized protein n=1 Tax=Punica granatum TaxID=22663 RepID=A0A2I0IFA9_PUNGR|nr:hypothetical protein CRG98_036949 [Punica granatum]
MEKEENEIESDGESWGVKRPGEWVGFVVSKEWAPPSEYARLNREEERSFGDENSSGSMVSYLCVSLVARSRLPLAALEGEPTRGISLLRLLMTGLIVSDFSLLPPADSTSFNGRSTTCFFGQASLSTFRASIHLLRLAELRLLIMESPSCSFLKKHGTVDDLELPEKDEFDTLHDDDVGDDEDLNEI